MSDKLIDNVGSLSKVDSDLVKQENKRRWINSIYLKRVEGIALSKDDYRFLINMQLSDGNEEFAKLIKADLTILDMNIDEVKDILDPEVYIKAKQGQAHLRNALYRNIKQGQKDDANTRRMDVDTLNRFNKLAKEGGYVQSRLRTKMENVLKKYDDKKTIVADTPEKVTNEANEADSSSAADGAGCENK